MRDINNNFDDFADFVAEATESIALLMADDEVREIFEKKKAPIKLIRPIMKNHRGDVAVILAAYRGMTVEEFYDSFNALGMVREFFDALKSPVLMEVFQSAADGTGGTSSPSAAGNIEE